MNTVDLLSRLRSQNIRLWAENDQLRYRAPKGKITDDLLAEIRKNKDELLNLVKNTERFRRAVPLSPVERTDTLRLSFAQQRLWFLDQLEPNSPLYNIPRAVWITGHLNIDALQSGLDTIVVRHEALRTRFAFADGSPVQVIAEHRSVELPVIDLRELSAVDRRAEVKRLCAEEARRPFDLSSDLMMRARLYFLDQQEHVLLLVIHHIAADGWSMGVLFRELSILYEAFAAGKPCPLQNLPYSMQIMLFGSGSGCRVKCWRHSLVTGNSNLKMPLRWWSFPRTILVLWLKPSEGQRNLLV